MRRRIVYVVLAFCVFQFSCTHTLELAGTTQTGNARVMGSIENPDGFAAKHTAIFLIPSDYDPVKANSFSQSGVLVDTTDTTGRFMFENVPAAGYNIQAVNNANQTRLLIQGVVVTDNDISVPGAALSKPAVVKVMLPDSIDPVNGCVYVPGTMIFCFLRGNTRSVTIDSVPASILPALMYGTANSAVRTIIRYNIQVFSGGTLVVANPAWKYSKLLNFNTTASGAQVSGNVADFPALIKLTKNNFNFAEARADGRDIRFAKADTVFLQYEIEQWDAARGQAEIWVKVDTVYGNDSSHSIGMYWGNANAPGVSNGAAVFDTADGFAAVWHFNNNCGDATANNYAGTNFGAIDTEGIIGNSKKFNGADSIRIVGLLGSPASVSLSAWAQLDSSSSYGGAEIVSLGDVAAIRMDDYRPNYGTMGTVHVSTTNNDTIFNDITSGGLDLAKTGWHYVAMTIDDANRLQSLYIDGTRYNQISNNALVNYSGVGINTLIGKHGNGKNNYNFIGSIDEVRVNKTVLSADWIRLCYMNQKASDMLVRFGK
jgi:Uncharacterized conserved protein